jgi:zinc transporter 9
MTKLLLIHNQIRHINKFTSFWRKPILSRDVRIRTIFSFDSFYKKKNKSNDDIEIEVTNERIHLESSRKVVMLALSGNLVITAFKGGCWLYTGSSAMLSEAIHSLVDSGNQALLLIGIRGAQEVADSTHQYGYGKSVYFWSLVSALGTFWCGAGISMWSSVGAIIHPVIQLGSVGWETWSVLGVSFAVDGFVLYNTLAKLRKLKPANMSLMKYIQNLRDPTTVAVILEDSAACLGVGIAVCGMAAVQITQIPVFDGIAGVYIAGLLGGMGFALARLNQKYLLGYSVDPEIIKGINDILISRRSIEEVHSVQSQWVGPYAFSYKAEVDFDGTFIAAKLMHRYQSEFMSTKKLNANEIKLLLSWYAEDVIRTVESEVKDLEKAIQRKYPEALYIELEPDGKKYSKYAIDDGIEIATSRNEMAIINQFEAVFQKEKEQSRLVDSIEYMKTESEDKK